MTPVWAWSFLFQQTLILHPKGPNAITLETGVSTYEFRGHTHLVRNCPLLELQLPSRDLTLLTSLLPNSCF